MSTRTRGMERCTCGGDHSEAVHREAMREARRRFQCPCTLCETRRISWALSEIEQSGREVAL